MIRLCVYANFTTTTTNNNNNNNTNNENITTNNNDNDSNTNTNTNTNITVSNQETAFGDSCRSSTRNSSAVIQSYIIRHDT